MAVPLLQYVAIKDKYCIGYFGEDESKVQDLLTARGFIEKEFPNLQIYLACKDIMKKITRGEKNVILEGNMQSYRGKVAYFRILEEKERIIDLLNESNITFPSNFVA